MPHAVQHTIADGVGLHRHAPFARNTQPREVQFPLVIVRSTNNRLRKRTRQSVSLLKALGRTTTHLPRVFVGVEVGPNEGSGSCGILASVFRLRG